MKLKHFLLIAAVCWGAVAAQAAVAVCPVCVVAVGAGVGLCRWLGVDDSISGLWIGGALAALSVWTYLWLKKKNWTFKFSKAVAPGICYLLVLVPLYFFDIIGHPLNRIFAVDKLLFGIISGTAVFLLGYKIDIFLRKKNQGKVLFYYQKVIIPFLFLLIATVVFYYIIKCY